MATGAATGIRGLLMDFVLRSPDLYYAILWGQAGGVCVVMVSSPLLDLWGGGVLFPTRGSSVYVVLSFGYQRTDSVGPCAETHRGAHTRPYLCILLTTHAETPPRANTHMHICTHAHTHTPGILGLFKQLPRGSQGSRLRGPSKPALQGGNRP